MAAKITVLVLCDADPDRPDYGGRRFDQPGPLTWRGLREGVPRLRSELHGLRDHQGRELPILWVLRADEQIAACHGDPGWQLQEFADLWTELQDAGHEIGWHPHHWRWSDEHDCWYQETRDTAWQRANLERGAAAFDTPPRFARMGWYAMNDATMQAMRDLGVEMDLSAMPGLRHPGGVDKRGTHFAGEYDWSRCRHGAYRPHAADYQSHAVRPSGLIEMPLTTIESAAVRTMYTVRYLLRGGSGMTGRYTSINITAHHAIFSLMMRHVLAQAEKRGHATLAAYFHPDELLGMGPAMVDRPLYHARHVGDNLRNLVAGAAERGMGVEFVTATEMLARLQERFQREAENAPPIFPVGKRQLGRAVKLAREVFNVSESDPDFADRFRWKHTVWSAKGPWISAAGPKTVPVGQYPSLALRTWFFDREVLSAHSCDTAVSASAQGKGLLGHLARTQYDRLREADFAFAWAFPNQRIHPIRTKGLAWTDVASFPFMLRPLDVKAVLSGALGKGLAEMLGPVAAAMWRRIAPERDAGAPLRLVPVERFGVAADDIWAQTRERLRIAVVRDAAALNARYAQTPGAPYRLYHVEVEDAAVGVVVTRLLPKRGLLTYAICEMLLPEEHLHLADDVVALLIHEAREAGAQVAGALCFSHQPEHRAFTRNDFVSVPTRFHPEPTYFCAYPLLPDNQAEAVNDAENWYLTWGDQDTV
ncbi:MAG: GNAT family N-acetyltransferase [Candidatus Lernaella stagnicola]|nr:GNAT family N-acetyltransferase [Candidatus Lernaella stagnicola]